MSALKPFKFKCPESGKTVTVQAACPITAQAQVPNAFARRYAGAKPPRTMILSGGGIQGRPVNIH